MTDDEINRRVAEIDGWHANNSDYPSVCWWFRGDEKHRGGPPPFATDWTWCGPLIQKYGMHCGRDLLFQGMQWSAGPPDMTWSQYADTPQRAICLAIIAANGQPADPGNWTGLGDK